jgi:hypothetical protein
MSGNKRIIAGLVMVASAIGALYVAWLVNPAYLPPALSDFLYSNLGERPFAPAPATVDLAELQPEEVCPERRPQWREAQTIDGVAMQASPLCHPDNPYEVAAFVKGTNNVSPGTLMQTQLTPDAVVKGRDLDGDGDPDEIHIRLEVAELNGHSPDAPVEVPGYSIAPGVKPGFWVFVPKYRGMATENLITFKAQPGLRMPSVPIRVEQGDKVKLTLENTHYLPHTIHLHGVDHPYQDENGEGNDGVPRVSEMPIMPGDSRTYDIQPRQSGTMFYHCHVQPQAHILMGLNSLFIVEENRPNNTVQTLNVGAGHVRYPSVAVRERYGREYDMHYQDVDYDMHNLIKSSNDPRVISERIHRRFNITQRKPEAFVLNGHSFPYTIRDSMIVVKENELIKMRVINGGAVSLALHTHGHKVTATHLDGILQSPAAQIIRDVHTIDSAQRADLELEATNDGLHNYGPGVWVMHDHHEPGTTTNGINMGGHISAIVYEQFLGKNGIPKIAGDLGPLFTPEYFRGEVPIFIGMDPQGLLSTAGPVQMDRTGAVLTVLLAVLLGLFVGTLTWLIRSPGGAASGKAKKKR